MSLLIPLSMLFISLFLTINLISQKIITCYGIYFTAGDLIFPFMYLISVLLTEVYHYRQSRLVIWSAFGCNFLIACVIKLAILLPINPNVWNQQTAFSLILGKAPRLLWASFIAFLTGELVCAKTVTILNKKYPVQLRSIFATTMGHLSDSLIFSFVAFLGTVSVFNVLRLMFSACCIKILVQMTLLPFITLLIAKIKQFEQR